MPRRTRLSRAGFKEMRAFKRLHGRYVSLMYGAIPGHKRGAACVVSKKVAASAVARNTFKRRCRAIFSGVLPRAAAPVLVCVAKKGAIEASFAALRADIEALVARIEAER